MDVLKAYHNLRYSVKSLLAFIGGEPPVVHIYKQPLQAILSDLVQIRDTTTLQSTQDVIAAQHAKLEAIKARLLSTGDAIFAYGAKYPDFIQRLDKQKQGCRIYDIVRYSGILLGHATHVANVVRSARQHGIPIPQSLDRDTYAAMADLIPPLEAYANRAAGHPIDWGLSPEAIEVSAAILLTIDVRWPRIRDLSQQILASVDARAAALSPEAKAAVERAMEGLRAPLVDPCDCGDSVF